MLIPRNNTGNKVDKVPISQSFQSVSGGEKIVQNTDLKDRKCYERSPSGGLWGSDRE